MLAEALFGDASRASSATSPSGTASPSAWRLWFYNFSTFRGRHGIYLEDLFVRPAARGHGLGKLLLANLARRCVAENLARLEWSVLDWNEPSIGFYQPAGRRTLLDGWTTCRLTDTALWRLADEAR